MYQLYGTVIVMTMCAFCNSFKQNTLIDSIRRLNLIDNKLLNDNRFAINYFKTRNFLISKYDDYFIR